MIPAVCWYFNILQGCVRYLWWFLVWLFLQYPFMMSVEGGGRMDEKDFLELLISDRMAMHYDRFKKECPPTAEQAAEAEEADRVHELLYGQLTPEQRELLELYEDGINSGAARENEFYYRAGFRDGINLDRLIKEMKEKG